MNKKMQLIIGITISIIISITIPVIYNLIPKKEATIIDVKKMQKDFDKVLKKTVELEKKKTEKEVIAELEKTEPIEEKVINKFASVFTKYYGEDNKDFKIQHSVNKKLWILSFGKNDANELIMTNDTGKEGSNGYELHHTYELSNEDTIVKQEAIITVVRNNNVKFDIYENDILIQYLNVILGREMNDKDKNAINVKVNMDLSKLTTIDELKTYIYNNDSLKIDDMIIKSENKDDVEKQRMFVTFTISSEKTTEPVKEKDK